MSWHIVQFVSPVSKFFDEFERSSTGCSTNDTVERAAQTSKTREKNLDIELFHFYTVNQVKERSCTSDNIFTHIFGLVSGGRSDSDGCRNASFKTMSCHTGLAFIFGDEKI